jgi:hypothetical protein
MKNLFLIFCIIGIFGCLPVHHKSKVHCYQKHSINDIGLDEVMYWYIWYGSNNQCYSYSTPRPISTFVNVNWTQSTAKPTEIENEKEVVEQELNDTELPQELQSEVEQSPEAEVDVDASSSGDVSGGDDSGGGDGGD